MSAAPSTRITVSGLSKSMATSLVRSARRDGMTVDAYVKALIARDVELNRLARTKNFAELAAPFQGALGGLSDDDLDRLSRPPARAARRKTRK
jgi:hypothetical protein